jgi:predicted kinase
MPRLLLINGAPGSGKSTLAAAFAQERAMTLALDVDGLKHALGRWRDDPLASGLHARRLALALAREQLRAGWDVVVGQYLARTDFIEQLERACAESAAMFVEVVLDLSSSELAARLAGRAAAPSRTEHLVHNQLVVPEDAQRLIESLRDLRETRPNAIWVAARGTVAEALARLRAVVG